MNCCQEAKYNKTFNTKVAVKEMAAYKKGGASKSTKKLIKSIIKQQNGSLGEKSLLDIGGGIGAVGLELTDKGLKSVTCVDVSTEYLAAAEKEVESRGLTEKFKFIIGDAVAKSKNLAEAEIVTLDKSICCYEDYALLVSTSLSKSKSVYGIVIPRDVWWVIAINGIGNLFRKLKGDSFRTFIHPVNQMRNLILRNGFREASFEMAREWLILVFVANEDNPKPL